MRPFFKEGERVIVEFGVRDPQLSKIIAVSHRGKMTTVLAQGNRVKEFVTKG